MNGPSSEWPSSSHQNIIVFINSSETILLCRSNQTIERKRSEARDLREQAARKREDAEKAKAEARIKQREEERMDRKAEKADRHAEELRRDRQNILDRFD